MELNELTQQFKLAIIHAQLKMWIHHDEWGKEKFCPFTIRKNKGIRSYCNLFCHKKWPGLEKIEVINFYNQKIYFNSCPCMVTPKRTAMDIFNEDILKRNYFITESAIMEYAYNTLVEIEKLIDRSIEHE